MVEQNVTDLAKELEHYETPQWAVDAILNKELITPFVIDPCTGTGVLAMACLDRGHEVVSMDIHDWGFKHITHVGDFLSAEVEENPSYDGNFSIFMNPPFSKAVEFVEKSLEVGATKIICFQRFAWWESKSRREFWENNPPSRVYICGDRATTWLHGLEVNNKGQRIRPETGKPMSNSSTAHAWFVWDNGAPQGTLLGHIWRDDK
jgi:predicted RNA methylase